MTEIVVGELSRARPRAIARGSSVTRDGATVVIAGGQIHVLNPTAAEIWRRCDGSVSVEALAIELAAEYSVPVNVVIEDVSVGVSGLLGRGLVAIGEPAFSPAEVKPVVETVPSCTGCGTGPDYEQQLLIDVGAVAVSIGCDGEVADAMEAALGNRVVGRRPDSSGPPSYGVVIPTQRHAPGRYDLARLHRGPDVLLTSRRPERVLWALLAQAATHEPPSGHMILNALAVGISDRVVVVPVPKQRVRFERAAARCGLAVSDAPAVAVDLLAATVAIGAPLLRPEPGALRSLSESRSNLQDDADPLPWGTYRLVGLGVDGPGTLPSVIGELGSSTGAGGSGRSALRDQLRGAAALPIVSCPSVEQIAELIR